MERSLDVTPKPDVKAASVKRTEAEHLESAPGLPEATSGEEGGWKLDRFMNYASRH